jgi:hypothetical protein
MMTMSAVSAIAVALFGTVAVVGMRFFWNVGSRPSRPRKHVTGRKAAAYSHPGTVADERGITARIAERASAER